MASARLKVPDCGPLLVFLTIANQIWIKFETLIVTAKKCGVNEYFQNAPRISATSFADSQWSAYHSLGTAVLTSPP